MACCSVIILFAVLEQLQLYGGTNNYFQCPFSESMTCILHEYYSLAFSLLYTVGGVVKEASPYPISTQSQWLDVSQPHQHILGEFSQHISLNIITADYWPFSVPICQTANHFPK